MPNVNHFMKQLLSRSCAVDKDHNPHANVIRSPSPSADFIYANGHGLPRGYTTVLYGPPKGGKSLYGYALAGQIHQDDPTAIVCKINTEYREQLQGGVSEQGLRKAFKIDESRYAPFETNLPSEIFDWFEKDLAEMCEKGANVPLVIIDSVGGIQGRREGNSDSIDNFQIGDLAQTLQVGLKRILPIQRKYDIALLLTAQVRAEMDPVQQRRGQTIKMAVAWAVKHHAEYFVYIERNETKEGKADLRGNVLRDDERKDIRLATEGEATGHKVRVIMKETSCGPRGRWGEFTFDYRRGIVNVHDEVFLLGKARGVIENAGNSYTFGERKWVGKDAIISELEKNPELQREIIKELRRRDSLGLLTEDLVQAPDITEGAEK